MKTNRSTLSFSLSCLVALTATAADLPPSGTNTISGVVRFTNADADILARLGPPGNEGMVDLVIDTYSSPPDSLRAVKIFHGVDKLSTPYALTVAANDVPLVYDVYPVLTLDDSLEEYWPPTQPSDPLTSNSPSATVNFNECVALLELRYVDTAGNPSPRWAAALSPSRPLPASGARAISTSRRGAREISSSCHRTWNSPST